MLSPGMFVCFGVWNAHNFPVRRWCSSPPLAVNQTSIVQQPFPTITVYITPSIQRTLKGKLYVSLHCYGAFLRSSLQVVPIGCCCSLLEQIIGVNRSICGRRNVHVSRVPTWYYIILSVVVENSQNRGKGMSISSRETKPLLLHLSMFTTSTTNGEPLDQPTYVVQWEF